MTIGRTSTPSNLVTQPLQRPFTAIQLDRYPPTKIHNLRMDVAEVYTRADLSQCARAVGMGALAGETLSSFQIEADGSSSAPDGSQLWQPMDVAEDFAVRYTGLRFYLWSLRIETVSSTCYLPTRNIHPQHPRMPSQKQQNLHHLSLIHVAVQTIRREWWMCLGRMGMVGWSLGCIE